MDIVIETLLYLLSGAAAGLLSGLFGVGGGIIIVPILSFLFVGLSFPTEHLMHLAIGTSLATVMVNALSSSWGHHQKQNIDWQLVNAVAPTAIISVFFGAWLAASIHSNQLKLLFASFECLVAIKLLLESKQADATLNTLQLTQYFTWALGAAVGLISSLLGIGGGTVSVPILMYLRMATRRAIGTSAAIGLPVSVAGVIGYLATGWNTPQLPSLSLGFIYLPAFAGIAVGSLFTTKIGVRLAHRLPVATLKKLLAMLLMLLGLKMGYSVF